MIEVVGNLWTYPADWRIITTNGYVKTNGECVMGRGCALEAKTRYPDVPLLLGKLIDKYGNVVQRIPNYGLIAFPVKHKWNEEADYDLIKQSAQQLRLVAECYPEHEFVMPRPGCGNGRRSWDVVKTLLTDLPDNVKVITFDKAK